MTTKIKLLITVLLIWLGQWLSMPVAADTHAETKGAPEVSADEAALIHWRMPEIERRFMDIQPIATTASASVH
jgi:hypothetical protein